MGAYATARSSSLASRCSRSSELEPAAQTIRNRVKQADLDDGRRDDGLTSQEQEEPKQLRRENKQLRLEREILARNRAPPDPCLMVDQAAAYLGGRHAAKGKLLQALSVPRLARVQVALRVELHHVGADELADLTPRTTETVQDLEVTPP